MARVLGVQNLVVAEVLRVEKIMRGLYRWSEFGGLGFEVENWRKGGRNSMVMVGALYSALAALWRVVAGAVAIGELVVGW